MKLLLISMMILFSNMVNAQLYNLIYMKIENGQITRNYNADEYAAYFMMAFSEKDYNKAINYLDSIDLLGEGDHKTLYNKAICYAHLENTDSVQKYIADYLFYEGEYQKRPGIFKFSLLFDYITKDELLLAEYAKLENTFCDTLSNCDFSMRIQVCDFKEQEILMDRTFINNKKVELRYELMANNSEPIIQILEKQGLPTKKEIGTSLALLEIIILHMDYSPKEQLKWSKKMLRVSEKQAYSARRAIYAIDRSLRNMERKQKYGSLIDNRGTSESSVYPYRGSLKRLNKRRKKYQLHPLAEESNSGIINGTL